MFEQLRETLEPTSLLALVPEEVLRGLMKGFFFGHKSGMVLIFNEGRTATNLLTLKRLDPIGPQPQGRQPVLESYNPFCARFRERPARDKLCEACDDRFARLEFEEKKGTVRHQCHMGLTDLTAPIRVNGRVRGVLFAGQKVVRNDATLQLIRRNVAAKAPDIAPELERLMDQVAIDVHELDDFEAGFREFAQIFQTTVNAFAQSRQHEAERDALLRVSEYLAQLEGEEVTGLEESTRPLFQGTDGLFRELESFVGGRPVWLLQRRGSRYACVAASPLGAALPGGSQVNLPVWVLIEIPVGRPTRLSAATPAGGELRRRLGVGGDELTVVRSESRTNQAQWSSVALVVGGPLQREHAPFLVGCARALTYATGILSLLRRLQKQQTDFTRTASFIGHHMKTPLQGALLDLREAALMTGASADEVRQRNTLLTDAESQIGLGLADALRLQGAAVATRKQRFDLYAQVAALVDDMRPLARAREIQIRLTPHAGTACVVLGVQLHVRVALSNLIENAIKYSYEEKSIEIRFSIPTTSSWQVVQIEIEDIGVGFPPEQKDRLFNLGTRLETASGKHARPGAGIGLMQAKEYLEAAGGSLDINSVPLATYTGHLSKVTALVHLPLA